MGWSVEFLNDGVAAEMSALAADVRARFERIVHLIETHGLENLREPYVKHLEDRLWEMRMKGRDGLGRAIYVTTSGRRVIVVHAFVKKTQKTPRLALQTARRRARDVP